MEKIHEYYANYTEETRLFDRQHFCEFLISMHLFHKYLPIRGTRILDCCAGTGAYAFALAEEGAYVTAGDLVPAHAEKMRNHPHASRLDEIYTGSAVDLSRFPDATFDVVLCMGALYHLDECGRDACIRECLRVLKPSGFIAFSWESVLALFLGQHLHALRQTTAQARRENFELLDSCLRTHHRDIFYYMTCEEVEALPDIYPIEHITSAVTYPAMYTMFPDVDHYSDVEYDSYIQCLYETCEDPLCVKYAMHGLYLAQKS